MPQENEPIEVSVVLPCLNEEKGLGLCIAKIKEVFSRERLRGEIVVADNGSTDNSVKIAQDAGARVVHEPQKGYGAAYLCGLRHARGRYIVIGDSDNTYDFNAIPAFLGRLREGCEFVLGSRFKGTMRKGAMSWSHRYVGNPILSGLCRLFFRTSLSDIHCGMRAFTRDAYLRMKLRTLGMEFATEMVVSALANDIKVCEIPIDYFPREGDSKLIPLADAWRHIRFMLLYSPQWLYFVPGVAGLTAGLLLQAFLLRGPVWFLGRQWDVHVMVFASMLSILSYQVFHLGVYAHTFAIRQGFVKYDRVTIFFQKRFNLEKGLLLGGVLFLAGVGVAAAVFVEWWAAGFGVLARVREMLLAMTLIVLGVQTVYSSFFISLLFLEKE